MAGVGVPFYPFFSTTYGDGFGYNERDGSNLNTFRNRYLNSEYRGASNSGPTRFANNAKATLVHSVTPASQTITQSAVPPLNFSRSAPLDHLNGSYPPPPPPPHRYPHDDVSVYHNNPISQVSTTSPSYAQTSRESLPLNRISPSFHHSYYYDDNRDGGDYSYSMSMKKKNEIPAQSIPFGRLNATSSLSSSSSSRSNTLDSKQNSARSAYDISYNKPGLTFEKAESSRHYGGQSISRRLPEGERLRYQVPGYMGFVRTVQFRHGDTYGKTTRKCLLNLPDHA